MIKKVGKTLLFGLIAGIIAFSCSNPSITKVDADRSGELLKGGEGYGVLKIDIPKTRGWTISLFTVIATKSGETPVTQTTTTNSISMRLKIGTWNLSVEGEDQYGNIVYKGTAIATVTETGTSVTIGLLKRAGNVKISLSSDYNIASGQPGSIENIIVTASRGEGFPDVVMETSEFGSSLIFTGLAEGEWNFTIQAQAADVDSSYNQTGTFSNYLLKTQTVSAVASKAITQSSQLLVATDQKIVTPVKFSHSSGSYSSNFYLSLSCDSANAVIYYTTNGANPTTASTQYTGAFEITSATPEIRAIAVKTGLTSSIVGARNYTINTLVTSTPQFSPLGGTFTGDQAVYLTCADLGSAIYYTTDGTDPVASATKIQYVSPVILSTDETTVVIKAYAIVSGKTDSDVVTQSYTISYPVAQSPTIIPDTGTYDLTQVFTIESGTANSTIYYTLDGSTPTKTSLVYTAPISFTTIGSKTIKAIAVANGYKNSLVSTKTFTIVDNSQQDSSFILQNAEVIIEDAENANIYDTLFTGLNWFGTDIFVSGGYTIEWSTDFQGTVTMYQNDTTTPVALSGSGNSRTVTLSGNETNPVRYFIKFNSLYEITDFQIKIYRDGAVTTTTTSTTIPYDGVIVYAKSNSAPTIWIWENSGAAISTLMGYTWTTQPTMTAVPEGELKNSSGWYKFEIPSTHLTGKNLMVILNSGATLTTGYAVTCWYDGSGWTNFDPTVPPTPEAPAVTISPSSGSVKGTAKVTISATAASATPITAISGTFNGTALTFTNNACSVTVSDYLTNLASGTISVSATNSVGTTTKTATITRDDSAVADKFTWDNALVYFVLTDRFYNGNTGNDYSYYRTNAAATPSIPDVATFHGGDIAGLTAKLDYLESLGINAIWITAPYEQMHGWVSGGGAFPHFAFHGYYTQDWTFMDKNMGTVEEFRAFVNGAHSRGIRVVMDVVMNHTGYNTIEDMITYSFGSTSVTTHGWIDGGSNWQNNHAVTDYTSSLWNNWWSSWVRAFDGQWDYEAPGGDDLTKPLAGLPDVVTEKTGPYTIPTFMQTKWTAENNVSFDNWRVPSASDLRTNLSVSPVEYITKWLASWVEEFGVDGFRCDTAKHIDMYRWGQLKTACNAALSEWRSSARATGDAKNWDENFWMTGECFGWTNSISGDYFTTGGFDSMINFAFNPTGNTFGSSSGSTPTTGSWESYASMINTNTNSNNMLSYISSHDTGLHRPSDMINVGTMLLLLPGGVQVFYGDETARPYAYTSCGDSDMMTRGDFNWGQENSVTTNHWKKVGTFRKNHPAVGAGVQTTLDTNVFGRTVTLNGEIDKVVIAIGKSGSASVKVTGIFADGTTVRNAYDGTTAVVASGAATFTATNGVILIEAN